jgi:hypothetical protein
MEISKIIEALQQTSLFDLYRLEAILRKMMTDPRRLNEVRSKLQPNQEITYFEPTANQEISATIINLGRTYAGVLNHVDGKRWKTPYYMINPTGLKIEFGFHSGKVDRLTLKVGEQVWVL